MYPLVENQPYAADMQRRMIDEIEAARPRFVVLVNVAVSWNVGQMSDRTLFRWWDRYQKGFERWSHRHHGPRDAAGPDRGR